MKNFILRYHRYIGLLAALPVIIWGLSGLAHPIMSRLQPQPATVKLNAEWLAMPSAEERNNLPSLENILQKAQIKTLVSARLIEWQQQPYWQITQAHQSERIYLHANTGERYPDLDKMIAKKLAQYFSFGENKNIPAIRDIKLIEKFNNEYAYINRLLPVYEISFDDNRGSKAYIDTGLYRLATLNDNNKVAFSKIFRNLHSWVFISSPSLRTGLMVFFLSLALMSVLGGLFMYIYFLKKPLQGVRKQPARRWHRRLALFVAISTLMFVTSAIFHLLHESEKIKKESPDIIYAEELNTPLKKFALNDHDAITVLKFHDTLYWQQFSLSSANVGKQAHHEHHKPATQHDTIFNNKGEVIENGEASLAKKIAEHYSGLSNIRNSERLERFSHEYGFVNKRLPVYRVNFNDAENSSLYIETRTATPVRLVADRDRIEGFSFAYLHKWNIFESFGKNIRDSIAGLFAFLNVLIVSLGIVIVWRTRRSKS